MDSLCALSNKEKAAIEDMKKYLPILWINRDKTQIEAALKNTSLSMDDVIDAEERWRRFSPLIRKLFPETEKNNGIIESALKKIDLMKRGVVEVYKQCFDGELYIKCDNELPIAGSIKARGGIYEVLKFAEKLAVDSGCFKLDDDYSILSDKAFRKLFGKYNLTVGSTGNLGLSIGIMGKALGFNVNVHMSADAKEWKKSLLRSKQVNVIEHSSDYSVAVAEGRKQSEKDLFSHFIDDENSLDLFLGYSAAALRLKKQLAEKDIIIDSEHPLFVYIPCGVGGAPGGICFGLKNVFGDNVHVFFVEPTHSPCMLLGLMTKMNEKISVIDIGLDNITEADGLAVGRASGLVGKTINNMLSGIYTIEDNELFKLLALLEDTEKIFVEPSAAAGLLGPVMLYNTEDGRRYLEENNLMPYMKNSRHIAWATGGAFVPQKLMQEFYTKGRG